MIKLTKSSQVPQSLSSGAVAAANNQLAGLVADGNTPTSKDFKPTLYGAVDVRKQLKSDQHNKCAYCECSLLNQDAEIEHFRPKTAYRQDKNTPVTKPAYYHLAYEWDNLLLCCHVCNRTKGVHFPLADPSVRFTPKEKAMLINPYVDYPAQHIEFRRYYVFPVEHQDGQKDAKGVWMTEILQLNRKDLVELRRRSYDDFLDQMEEKGVTFDETLSTWKDRAQRHGRSPESIEFLGMYDNQKCKF